MLRSWVWPHFLYVSLRFFHSLEWIWTTILGVNSSTLLPIELPKIDSPLEFRRFERPALTVQMLRSSCWAKTPTQEKTGFEPVINFFITTFKVAALNPSAIFPTSLFQVWYYLFIIVSNIIFNIGSGYINIVIIIYNVAPIIIDVPTSISIFFVPNTLYIYPSVSLKYIHFIILT